MRDHEPEAVFSQAQSELRKPERPAGVRELEQQPPLGAAEPEAAKLFRLEPREVPEGQLSSGAELEVDSGLADGPPQLGQRGSHAFHALVG